MPKKKDLPKILSFFLVLFLLSGCGENLNTRLRDFKEESLERIKVMLADVPLIGRWVKLHPKPSALYKDVEDVVLSLKAKGIEKYLPDEFERFERKWKMVKKLYSERLYLQAEKRLKTLTKEAKELNEKLDKTLSALKSSAIQKYKEREAEAYSQLSNLNEEEKLKLKVYLFYLKSLIEQGRFEEFEREFKRNPFGKS